MYQVELVKAPTPNYFRPDYFPRLIKFLKDMTRLNMVQNHPVHDISWTERNINDMIQQIQELETPCSISILGRLIPLMSNPERDYLVLGMDTMWEVITERNSGE